MKMFNGKHVLITGANGGIGRALVKEFASEGASIIAHIREKTKEFDMFISDISKEYEVEIYPIIFDLRTEEAISDGLRQLFEKKVRIDVLINNAGIVGENCAFHMTKISEMKTVFDVNFFAAIKISQLICRLMMRNGGGSIVNVSSVAGLDGDPGQLEYSCSKAAIICATKKMAIELGKYGIRVNAVAPGLTNTKMLDNMKASVEKEVANRSIMGRRCSPGEIASAIVFLASEKASFITGQVIRVDGGSRVVVET